MQNPLKNMEELSGKMVNPLIKRLFTRKKLKHHNHYYAFEKLQYFDRKLLKATKQME